MSLRAALGVTAAALLLAALTACGGSASPGGGAGASASAVSASVTASPGTGPSGHPTPSASPRPVSPVPSATASPPSGGTAVTGALAGRDWTYIPTTRHVVALTFDAGANADGVPSILATLRAAHVPATFFLTGNFVRAYPAVAKQIAASGARIGDHTITHPHLTQLSDAAVRAQIVGAASQIQSATGVSPVPLFRFPFGDADARTIAIANRAGFVPVRWTVDTLGWEGKAGHISADVVIDRVMAELRPGEIVLMHVGSNPDDHTTYDANALPELIRELRDHGYSFVTLAALTG